MAGIDASYYLGNEAAQAIICGAPPGTRLTPERSTLLPKHVSHMLHGTGVTTELRWSFPAQLGGIGRSVSFSNLWDFFLSISGSSLFLFIDFEALMATHLSSEHSH